MKVLIPIKRVLDYRVRVRVLTDESGVDLSGVKMGINPFDEIAIEEGVRAQEKGLVKELVLLSIGPDAAEDVLRSGLALGGDRGIHVQTSTTEATPTTPITLSPLNIAKILKEMVAKERPDFVLMGKQAIDDDCNQTGQMLAGLLNWPQGMFVSQLDLNPKKKEALVVREVDGGLEELRLQLPAVITTDLRLNEPRFASLPNIMKARSKPLEMIPLESLQLDLPQRHTVEKVTEPSEKAPGVMVKSVDELMEKLISETQIF